MSKRNENRPGYKKTKAGWIPEEWRCYKGLDITKLIGKGASPKWQGYNYSSSGMLFITSENVRDGYLDINSPKFLPLEFHKKLKRTKIQKGDLLINLVGASIGRSCLVTKNLGPANVNQAVSVFRIRDNICREYVAYFFQTSSTIKRILAMQVDAARPNISLTDLRNFLVPLPSLPEQKKIAEILSTWDETIDQTRKLIDAKKRRKKALMQHLLTGKKRLLGFREASKSNSKFPSDWQSLRARDIFESRSVKNYGNEPVLSVTQDKGVVLRNSMERRIEASEANTNSYKLVEPGDFVISLRSFQGGLEFSRYKGIVSPAYHVIRPKRKIDDVFFRYYFKSYDFIGHLAIAVIGIRDGKQVSYSDFAFMYLPYPPIDEQKMIGTILSTADEEIKTLEKKLAAVEKQKRGLMQKLLTGEVRVNV
jgi:type I restriction enzyme, S subunit